MSDIQALAAPDAMLADVEGYDLAVGITTCNRAGHLRRCVESLRGCTHAERTVLYIAVDHPPSEAYVEGHREVVRYLEGGVSGFLDVRILWRSENLGQRGNGFGLRHEMFSEHERIIFTEDDNTFSPGFLDYMWKGFSFYENDPTIWAICGYNDPVQIPSWYAHAYYLRTGSCMWGVGLWKSKVEQVEWSMDLFGQWVLRSSVRRKISKYHAKAIPQLVRMVSERRLLTDGYVFVYLLVNGMRSVYPTRSLVRNIGHDGTGQHCGVNARYAEQPIVEGAYFDGFRERIGYNEALQRVISRQLDGNLWKRLSYRSHFWPPVLRRLYLDLLAMAVRVRAVFGIGRRMVAG